ncbi:unnamed protein product [Prorocentrum cordatum]|uniref:Peptidase C1A papain C-terminal domain-containing protein n=1 Tax=Prorocentrum cordatum TaxID=2364126 RepID=A0ABN9SJ09_9DINO|nr:unnamed protein product [Polarella glacialis]
MEGLTEGRGLGPHVDAAQWKTRLKNATDDEKPISTEAFVEGINGQNLGYMVVKRSAMESVAHRDMNSRLGLLLPSGPLKEAPIKVMSSSVCLPRSIDAFGEWPGCHGVIRRDRKQGRCASCRAFAALSLLDCRLCIKTQGMFNGVRGHLRRAHATSCICERDGCQPRSPA